MTQPYTYLIRMERKKYLVLSEYDMLVDVIQVIFG